jgi:hypothetical protein
MSVQGVTRMQDSLPLGAASSNLLAHGLSIDYANGRIEPARVEAIPPLLAAISRYGSHRPLVASRTCTVLCHSASVAVLAYRIVRRASKGPDEASTVAMLPRWRDALSCVVGMYGGLHDVGEIFGGDVSRRVPEQYRRELQVYQAACRSTVLSQMGIPEASGLVDAVWTAADDLVIAAEMTVMGFDVPTTPAATTMAAARRVEDTFGVDPGRTLDEVVKWVLSNVHGEIGGTRKRFAGFDAARGAFLRMCRPPVFLFSEDRDGVRRLVAQALSSDLRETKPGESPMAPLRDLVASATGDSAFTGFVHEPCFRRRGGFVVHRVVDGDVLLSEREAA